MKKVLFTSHVANFVKFNRPYMQWFQDQGWEVHYASLDEEEIPCCDQHFKVQFNRSPYSPDNIKAYFQLKKIIDREHYDIIHCHTPMGGVVTRLAARTARKVGTKVIYTAHGFHFYKGAPIVNWMFYYPMEKLLSRCTDSLITMNEEDYQTAKIRQFRAGRIEKIDGVGVDLTRFHPVSKEERQNLRKQMGYGKDDFILVCVAEFIPRKNQGEILELIPHLLTRSLNIKLIYAGCGKTLDSCKNILQELKLENYVDFLGYRRDVEKLYAISDVLVSSSKQEGLPINVIEGMASGLPVVATKIRGHVDVIEPNKNGYLYDLGDSTAFCKYIMTLWSNEKLRIKMKENNLADAGKYTVEHALAQMKQIYESVW